MSLLEQDTTRKERADWKVTKLKFEVGYKEKYSPGEIWDSAIKGNDEKCYLPELYYLVYRKSYPEEDDNWKPASAV